MMIANKILILINGKKYYNYGNAGMIIIILCKSYRLRSLSLYRAMALTAKVSLPRSVTLDAADTPPMIQRAGNSLLSEILIGLCVYYTYSRIGL